MELGTYYTSVPTPGSSRVRSINNIIRVLKAEKMRLDRNKAPNRTGSTKTGTGTVAQSLDRVHGKEACNQARAIGGSHDSAVRLYARARPHRARRTTPFG